MKRRTRFRHSAPALALALSAAPGFALQPGINEYEKRVPAHTRSDRQLRASAAPSKVMR